MAKKNQNIERDAHDGGVPMIPATEPRGEASGPEDAFGVGPKRGDYSKRLGGSDYNPHTVVPVEHMDEDGGITVQQVMVDQKALAEEIGDEPGLKGGVDTHTDKAAADAAGLQSVQPASSDSSSGSKSSGSGSSS
jgi:hypothetical protein